MVDDPAGLEVRPVYAVVCVTLLGHQSKGGEQRQRRQYRTDCLHIRENSPSTFIISIDIVVGSQKLQTS